MVAETVALQQLCDGKLHFRLILLCEPSCPGIEVQPFLTDSIELIVPTHHPWKSREETEVNEIVETEVIMREPGSGAYDTLYPQLAQVGILLETPYVLMTLGNDELIVLAVKEGLGVAFISRMVIDKL